MTEKSSKGEKKNCIKGMGEGGALLTKWQSIDAWGYSDDKIHAVSDSLYSNAAESTDLSFFLLWFQRSVKCRYLQYSDHGYNEFCAFWDYINKQDISLVA